MASSIYVYDNIEQYEMFYKGYLKELTRHLPIIDFYIKDKTKLWVVTNTNNLKEKPSILRSLVHFRNGNIDGYNEDGKVILVLHNKLNYNKKKNILEFFPRFLRKPLLSWHVDRYITSDIKNKNKKINLDQRFYDYEHDRINLVLKLD